MRVDHTACQVELEDGVADVGPVHHVDDVVRDGEADRGVAHLVLVQGGLEGQLQLYAGAAFSKEKEGKVSFSKIPCKDLGFVKTEITLISL